MKQTISLEDFALAVVSANPVNGDTPEAKAQNALELYLATKAVAKRNC